MEGTMMMQQRPVLSQQRRPRVRRSSTGTRQTSGKDPRVPRSRRSRGSTCTSWYSC
uniref:Alternative protein SSH3 n=1 Tax=Homo sapiens TaxID=9606 RepID=L8EA09_HUMAN|nr:alternative protein SSH3 [Homo sapiens]